MSNQEIIDRYAPLFMPKTVAVVGASTKGAALPNIFIRRIREFGFEGAIYPIHPSAAEIDGLPAYRTLADTPQPVDYAYIAVSAAQIPAMLSAAAGRVRYAQVISSGFGEVEAGKNLQRNWPRGWAGGMRLLDRIAWPLYTTRQSDIHRNRPARGRHRGIVSQAAASARHRSPRHEPRPRIFGVGHRRQLRHSRANDMLEFYLVDRRPGDRPL